MRKSSLGSYILKLLLMGCCFPRRNRQEGSETTTGSYESPDIEDSPWPNDQISTQSADLQPPPTQFDSNPRCQRHQVIKRGEGADIRRALQLAGNDGTIDWRLQKFHRNIDREKLVRWMDSSSADNEDYIVIDVRDPSLDYPGGHIRGSIHVQHVVFIKTMPQLIREHHGTRNIIIHCMYSQSRGPLCCKWYCMGIRSLLHRFYQKKETLNLSDENEEWEGLDAIDMNSEIATNLIEQNVFLLKDGFRGWVNQFRDDSRYVEDFDGEQWTYMTIGGKRELYHKNDW